MQELQAMLQQAKGQEGKGHADHEANWETSYQSEYQAKTMDGLQCVCAV